MTWYVSREARRHVTVALTGDGGDESWAGYDFRYVPHALEGAARRFIPDALGPTVGWVGRRWPRNPRLPKALRAGTLLVQIYATIPDLGAAKKIVDEITQAIHPDPKLDIRTGRYLKKLDEAYAAFSTTRS